MRLNLKERISSLRKPAAAQGPEPTPRSPQDEVLLASPLNHPLLVEQALGLLEEGAEGGLAASDRKLRLSWLFDPAFYLAANPDVDEAGEHPYVHFLVQGVSEGRSPHPLVDLAFLAASLSRTEAPWTVQELADALRSNEASPHRLFDVQYYLKCNPDVREGGWGAFEHFLAHGAEEGRAPNADFIVDWYLEQDPALPRGRLAAFVHYVRTGVREGRLPGPAAKPAPGTPAPEAPAPAPPAPPAPEPAAPEPRARKVEGRLDQVRELEAIGWAWAPGAPDEAIQIELIAEGRVVGLGAADLLRPDLKDGGLGNGHHAFKIPLSRALLDGHLHLVSARVRHQPAETLAGAHRVRFKRTDQDVLDAIPVQVAVAALAEQGIDPAFADRAAEAFMALETGDASATAAIEAMAEERADCGIVVAKLAETRLRAGDAESALSLYERALQLGGVPEAWLHLGMGTTLRRLDRKQDAAAAYAQGLRLAPALVRLQVRSRESAMRERLLECSKALADNRPEAALAILGDLLVHAPDDGAVQSLALQARRVVSGLATDGLDAPLASAHRELDLLETVLQHLERGGGRP